MLLLTNICNSTPRGSGTFSGLLGHCLHVIHRHTCRQNTDTHEIKINFKKVTQDCNSSLVCVTQMRKKKMETDRSIEWKSESFRCTGDTYLSYNHIAVQALVESLRISLDTNLLITENTVYTTTAFSLLSSSPSSSCSSPSSVPSRGLTSDPSGPS